MRARERDLLEETIRQGLSAYFHRDINDHVTQVEWVRGFDGVCEPVPDDRVRAHIADIVEGAMRRIMNAVDEYFVFPDPETGEDIPAPWVRD